MLFNDRLDAVVALTFMAVAVRVIVVSIREWVPVLRHRKPAVLREAPFVPSALGVAGDRGWEGTSRARDLAARAVLDCLRPSTRGWNDGPASEATRSRSA
jgi:hypothetical protein